MAHRGASRPSYTATDALNPLAAEPITLLPMTDTIDLLPLFETAAASSMRAICAGLSRHAFELTAGGEGLVDVDIEHDVRCLMARTEVSLRMSQRSTRIPWVLTVTPAKPALAQARGGRPAEASCQILDSRLRRNDERIDIPATIFRRDTSALRMTGRRIPVTQHLADCVQIEAAATNCRRCTAAAACLARRSAV